MAIEIRGGRPRSVRTEKEVIEDMVSSLEAMNPNEQAAFLHYLDKLEQGEGDVLDKYVNIEYIEEPVDPLTFLLDDYYLVPWAGWGPYVAEVAGRFCRAVRG